METRTIKPKCWVIVAAWKIRACRSALRLAAIKARVAAAKRKAA